MRMPLKTRMVIAASAAVLAVLVSCRGGGESGFVNRYDNDVEVEMLVMPHDEDDLRVVVQIWNRGSETVNIYRPYPLGVYLALDCAGRFSHHEVIFDMAMEDPVYESIEPGSFVSEDVYIESGVQYEFKGSGRFPCRVVFDNSEWDPEGTDVYEKINFGGKIRSKQFFVIVENRRPVRTEWE